MSAKASLDRNGTATGTSLAGSSHETQNIQSFFIRVYSHLKEGRLPKAIDLIEKEGDAYHKNLGGSNQQPIIAFISKEGLTDDQRACKLVTILKKFQALFPEVNPDDFETVRMRQKAARAMYIASNKTSAASVSAPKKAVSDAQAVKMVKAIGRQAGLSESDVENALEEIVLNDGSRTWMIKTVHTDQYKAWENALIKLASSEELIFFCESLIRNDREERLVCLNQKLHQRGFVRGMETEISMHQILIISGLIALLNVKAEKDTPDKLFKIVHQILCNMSIHSQAQKDLSIAVERSSTAALVQLTLQTSVNDDTDLGEYLAISKTLFEQVDLIGWEAFLLTLAYITFHASSSSECEKALEEWLNDYKKLGREMIDTKRFIPLKDKFLAEWRKVRDPSYASIFRSERTAMPKGIPTFVLFGRNHASGFKQALTALGTQSAESKDPGDSKEGKK